MPPCNSLLIFRLHTFEPLLASLKMRCRPLRRYPFAALAVSLFQLLISIKSMTAVIQSTVCEAALITVADTEMIGNSVHNVTQLFGEESSPNFRRRIRLMLPCAR